jgi:hypothetical protein
MAWSEAERRRNTIQIMLGDIQRDATGQKLTPEAQQRAAEFGAAAWKGNMENGDAVRLGIKHVTDGILKE